MDEWAMDGQTDKSEKQWMGRRMDGWMNGWMDGWMDGWINGWMDG